MSSPAIPDEEVVDIAPLNQGPPLETAEKAKRQKVGMPLPKKQRPVSLG
jgi:hypothetical protein